MASTTNHQSDVWTDPAIVWLEQKAKAASDDADELRASTDRVAKALSALALTGLTAVGIAKVGVVYPWPSDDRLEDWVYVVFLGFLSMAASVVLFVIRFWKANRPLAMSTNIERLKEDKVIDRWRESEAVDRIYTDAIKHAPFTHGADEPLAAYERRADKLEEEALYTPESPISTRRLAQVARMRAEIERAEQRAKLVVVRRRMNGALTRPAAFVLTALFVAGLVGFAVAADRLESERLRTCIEDGHASTVCELYVK